MSDAVQKVPFQTYSFFINNLSGQLRSRQREIIQEIELLDAILSLTRLQKNSGHTIKKIVFLS